MVREEIGRLLRQAAEVAQQRALPQVALPEITVEPPQRAEHGDYATNLALRLARAARMAPPQIAQILIQSLPPTRSSPGRRWPGPVLSTSFCIRNGSLPASPASSPRVTVTGPATRARRAGAGGVRLR